MYNKVILAGYVSREVELRYTPNGVAVATIPIAVNTRLKQGEEFKDEVLFIDCVIFGKQAESSNQYLSKGSPVLVEGRLRKREWEYEGQKKSKMEIIATGVKFLPSRDREKDVEVAPEETIPTDEPF